MACLSQACTRVLNELPTSLEQDEQLIAALPAGAAQQPAGLALRWRMEYKRWGLLLICQTAACGSPR